MIWMRRLFRPLLHYRIVLVILFFFEIGYSISKLNVVIIILNKTSRVIVDCFVIQSMIIDYRDGFFLIFYEIKEKLAALALGRADRDHLWNDYSEICFTLKIRIDQPPYWILIRILILLLTMQANQMWCHQFDRFQMSAICRTTKWCRKIGFFQNISIYFFKKN